MIKIEKSVVIDRRLEEVFAYVTDIENMPVWSSEVEKAWKTSEGPLDKGTTLGSKVKLLGRQIENTLEVTEYEPNKVVASKSTSGPFPFTEKTTFASVADGTKVTMEFEGEIGGFFKMAESMVLKTGMKQIEGDFAKLKNLLEDQG